MSKYKQPNNKPLTRVFVLTRTIQLIQSDLEDQVLAVYTTRSRARTARGKAINNPQRNRHEYFDVRVFKLNEGP